MNCSAGISRRHITTVHDVRFLDLSHPRKHIWAPIPKVLDDGITARRATRVFARRTKVPTTAKSSYYTHWTRYDPFNAFLCIYLHYPYDTASNTIARRHSHPASLRNGHQPHSTRVQTSTFNVQHPLSEFQAPIRLFHPIRTLTCRTTRFSTAYTQSTRP